MKKISLNHVKYFLFAVLTCLVIAEPALAKGGLAKVNTFVQNIVAVLRAIAIGVATIAFMWAGYKFFFQNASKDDVKNLVFGGLLVGGAGELANWILS